MEQQSFALARLSHDTVLAALSRHVGKGHGIRIGTLVFEATGEQPCAGSERRAREIVVELRKQGLHICSDPRWGYFMAANEQELNECCRALYDRAMTGLQQVAAMRRAALPDLRGQLRLPD